MFDRLSVNSAVAGGTGNICATALLRQQWTGFDGAPKTGLINLQGPINKINSGVGLSVYYDKLGQERSTIVRLHYAYHLKVGAQSTLSAGFYVGMSGRALDSKWIAIDPVADDKKNQPRRRSRQKKTDKRETNPKKKKKKKRKKKK